MCIHENIPWELTLLTIYVPKQVNRPNKVRISLYTNVKIVSLIPMLKLVEQSSQYA